MPSGSPVAIDSTEVAGMLKRLYDKRAKMMKVLRDEFERASGAAPAEETDSKLPMHR